MAYYYLFGFFSALVNYFFQVSVNLKAVLPDMAKITLKVNKQAARLYATSARPNNLQSLNSRFSLSFTHKGGLGLTQHFPQHC